LPFLSTASNLMRMRLLLNDCRGVVATPAAPRCMARSGRAGTSELGGELTYQRS